MHFAVIFLVFLATVFLFFQLLVVVRTRTTRGKPVPRLQGAYGEALASGEKSLFYFHSPSCRMCVPMGPVIDHLAEEFPHVFKVDVKEEPGVARAFGVMATPSVILVQGGVIRAFLLGPQTESKLRQWLQA